MIVLILTDCPPALRGDLTKWLQEVNTNVYVGRVSARVRDQIWKRVQENAKSGRATMIFHADNEQRLDFRVHNTTWEPIDFDGIKLMLRPSPARLKKISESRIGFSKAAKMRKASKMTNRRRKSSSFSNNYIVLDIETTGLSLVEDQIIEIGAILVEDKKIKSEFHALIKSNVEVPSSIEALTGISKEMLDREGKELSDVLPQFFDFINDLPIISHNADFDMGFLRSACQRLNLPMIGNRCIDTLSIARRTLDDVKDYKLETLLNYFNISADGLHRSIKDCICTQQLYNKLIEMQEAME